MSISSTSSSGFKRITGAIVARALMPTNTEGLERDMRFAVGHVEVAMELIYEALTEESVATTQPDS